MNEKEWIPAGMVEPLAVGDKIRVEFPDGAYEGVVQDNRFVQIAPLPGSYLYGSENNGLWGGIVEAVRDGSVCDD
jgi:hypothetical protein